MRAAVTAARPPLPRPVPMSTKTTIPNLQVLRPEERDMITDVVFMEPREMTTATDLALARAYIGENTPRWIVDPSGRRPEDLLQLTWLADFYSELRKAHETSTSFRFSHEGNTFRARRRIKDNGDVRLTLRKIPETTPDLSELQMPPYASELLLSLPLKRSGGLVLVVAPVGQGKSTTLAATLQARSKKYGGQTLTIEDPVEHYLDGFHVGEQVGEIIQTSVPTTGDGAWADAVRSSLGEFSVFPGGGATLFISEIRDGETAAEALRAAQAGYLVFATLHAQNIPNTIFRLITLASDVVGQKAAHDMVASALRMVAYQTLTLIPRPLGWRRGSLKVDILFNAGPSSPIANAIRDPNKSIEALQQPLADQATVIANGIAATTPFPKVYASLGGNPDDLD